MKEKQTNVRIERECVLRFFSLRRDETIDGRVNNNCKNSESVEFNVAD